jgi:hypothetical protein
MKKPWDATYPIAAGAILLGMYADYSGRRISVGLLLGALLGWLVVKLQNWWVR